MGIVSNVKALILHFFQKECSYFLSESTTCKLYKWAALGFTEGNKTNAGICPKYDKTRVWATYIPPQTPVPERRLLCGDKDKICTFPFSYLSKLYYDPYKDTSGVARCGTKSTSLGPVVYKNVDKLDSVIPCSGE